MEGLPCGPGFGKCETGLTCLEENGQAICKQPTSVGESCAEDGSICEAGTICAESGDSDGFSDAVALWSTGLQNSGTLTHAYELGILFVGEPTVGRFRCG